MTETSYDQIAAWYDACIRRDSPVSLFIREQLLRIVGDPNGQQICDLACGQGQLARELSGQGASVVGVDLSADLIAIARRDEQAEPLSISYLVDDAQTLSRLEDDSFDGLICNMALMDIPDLAATYQAIHRVLRAGGWFVFSITHPCFQSPHAEWTSSDDGTVSRRIVTYFEEGFWRSGNPAGVRGKVGAYHRTLSSYLNELLRTGFDLARIVEPRGAGPILESVPGYAVVPAFMMIRCQKR